MKHCTQQVMIAVTRIAATNMLAGLWSSAQVYASARFAGLLDAGLFNLSSDFSHWLHHFK